MVENKPGACTVIGTELVERAAPDGNTVLLVANSFVINPPLKRATYDVAKNFEPVCYLAATPMVLVCKLIAKHLCHLLPLRETRANPLSPAAGPAPLCMSRSRCSSAKPSSISITCPMAAPRLRSIH